MNRNRIMIAGGIILAVLLALISFTATFLLRAQKNNEPQIGHRILVPRLQYCASARALPCVDSFQLDARGKLVVRVLTEDSLPDFALRIRSSDRENLFPCEKQEEDSNWVLCTGDALPVGEALQFAIVSAEQDAVLAEGKLPIIGIALATPKFATTPTPVSIFDHPPR